MPARAALAITLTAGLAGCAPSLSTFQPAHVAPLGRLAVSAGLEGGLPLGAFSTLVDAGKQLATRGQRGEPLTDDEKWKIFDAGVNLMLTLPSVGPHAAVTYVPVERFELGLRYAGSAFRLGGRFQVLSRDEGPCDLTVGLGVSRFSYSFPISDEIPVLKLDDFARWQLDVPILAGTSRDWFHVWAGPKVLLTTFSTRITLSLPGDVTTVNFDGTASAVGGQAGIAFGYRRLFVAFELTLAEVSGTAHLTAIGLEPSTHVTRVSSFTIFPSVGLMGEI